MLALLLAERPPALVHVLEVARVAPRGLRDRPVGTETRVEGRLGVVGEVRLAEVDVGEEALVAVLLEPVGHHLAEHVAAAAERAEHLLELRKAAVEAEQAPGHGVRHEAARLDALRREQLGEGEPVLGQPRRKGDLAVVAVRVLRGPDRRHRTERVDRRGVDALEDDALRRQAVDLGGRLARIAVGAERARAAGVEDHEQHVGRGQALAQRVGSGVVGGRERPGLERLAAFRSEHPRRDEPAPRETRAADRPDGQADPNDVARPPREPHHLLAHRLGRSVDHAAPDLALAARLVFEQDAEGRGARGGAGRRQELGREAQLGRRRQPEREAHHRRADERERRHALLLARRERPRRLARQQVLERHVRGGAGHERVEGRRELPPVEALRIGVRGRGRRLEHEAQAVVTRLLGRRGQRDAVAVARVVEREALDGGAVEPHLRRPGGSLRGTVRRRGSRRAARPGPRQRPPPPRPSTTGTAPPAPPASRWKPSVRRGSAAGVPKRRTSSADHVSATDRALRRGRRRRSSAARGSRAPRG